MADEVQSNLNMETRNLFLSKEQKWVTNFELADKLISLGADNCRILYIHSALTFGTPNKMLSRSELLNEIYQVILSLGVETICMPTFTFSFPNGKDFDPNLSKSRMGALNEYFRIQAEVIRSNDPLMSIALKGRDKEIATSIGKYSIGKQSSFDNLRNREKVKFLFLGTKIGDCFTYMHYLEWLYNVDYRYNRPFTGIIKSGDKQLSVTYNLFVRYNDVKPNKGSYSYEELMYEKEIAKRINIGDSTLSIVEESLAAEFYKKCLEKSKYFFVDLINEKPIYDTSFHLDNEMVAL